MVNDTGKGRQQQESQCPPEAEPLSGRIVRCIHDNLSDSKGRTKTDGRIDQPLST
jgi:hypothetical protein